MENYYFYALIPVLIILSILFLDKRVVKSGGLQKVIVFLIVYETGCFLFLLVFGVVNKFFNSLILPDWLMILLFIPAVPYLMITRYISR